MAFKTILAVSEVADGIADRMGFAVRLARACEAHLAVLLVGEVPTLPFYGYGGAGFSKVWVTEVEETAARARRLAEDLESTLAREDISFEVRAHSAVPAREDNLVARHALYSDLTVILRSDDEHPTTVERQAIDGAVFDSGRPVLYVPHAARGAMVGNSVLVAWNSRPEAAEALSDAMPFLIAADKVTLAVVDPVRGPDDHGDAPGNDIAVLLARHGVAVEVRPVEANGRLVSTALREEAEKCGADMIVMGAYGHARMTETILGGTTREMLDDSVVPLFFAH